MSKMKTISIILPILWAVMVLDCPAELSRAEDITADIQKQLPEGWKCILISERGKMGHPHGLGEPLFRLDFTNAHLTFKYKIDAGLKKGQFMDVHPNLRLHFHDAAEREHVLQTIHDERIYSWDIPVLFADTKEHVVVTSPLWLNPVSDGIITTAVRTKESHKATAPLVKALKAYLDGRK